MSQDSLEDLAGSFGSFSQRDADVLIQKFLEVGDIRGTSPSRYLYALYVELAGDPAARQIMATSLINLLCTWRLPVHSLRYLRELVYAINDTGDPVASCAADVGRIAIDVLSTKSLRADPDFDGASAALIGFLVNCMSIRALELDQIVEKELYPTPTVGLIYRSLIRQHPQRLPELLHDLIKAALRAPDELDVRVTIAKCIRDDLGVDFFVRRFPNLRTDDAGFALRCLSVYPAEFATAVSQLDEMVRQSVGFAVTDDGVRIQGEEFAIADELKPRLFRGVIDTTSKFDEIVAPLRSGASPQAGVH